VEKASQHRWNYLNTAEKSRSEEGTDPNKPLRAIRGGERGERFELLKATRVNVKPKNGVERGNEEFMKNKRTRVRETTGTFRIPKRET